MGGLGNLPKSVAIGFLGAALGSGVMVAVLSGSSAATTSSTASSTFSTELTELHHLEATQPVGKLESEMNQLQSEFTQLDQRLSRLNSVGSAASDEVSAAIAAQFSHFAQEYQALNARAAAFHQEFVQILQAGASAYAAVEHTNTSG